MKWRKSFTKARQKATSWSAYWPAALTATLDAKSKVGIFLDENLLFHYLQWVMLTLAVRSEVKYVELGALK